jgi:hypothetical protein
MLFGDTKQTITTSNHFICENQANLRHQRSIVLKKSPKVMGFKKPNKVYI